MSSAPLPQVYACYSNHFDLIWRRCWKRGYEYDGLFYRSYADLEEAIISRWLDLAATQGAAFQIEQALTLREYLRRHPDTLPQFQQLAREGRFELLGSGEAIIDLNMCHGETMTRNFASGVTYARQMLGQETAFASHADGFGSSAQFPQVVRLCGMRGIADLSYSTPDGPYWRGMDGSAVLIVPRPGKNYFYDHCYYEPCLACRGYGRLNETPCAVCAGTGLRLSQGSYPPRELWSPEPDSPHNFYVVGSEEMLPDTQISTLMATQNTLGAARWQWRTQMALMPLWEEGLARVDDADLPLSSRVENNPVQTGTLVTRIRIKQAARQAEAWFYAAEKLVALTGPGAGGEGQRDDLEKAWLQLPLLFFHDAITGTHIDPALNELIDAAQEVVTLAHRAAAAAASSVMSSAEPITLWEGSGSIAVFNPNGVSASLPVEVTASGDAFQVMDSHGNRVPVYRQPSQDAPGAEQPEEVGANVPGLQAVGAAHWRKRGEDGPRTLRFLAADLPPLGIGVFHVAPAAVPAEAVGVSSGMTAGGYRVGWDDHGVNSLVDSASAEELLPFGKGSLGHLILEEDRGDPWGTRFFERPRTPCAAMTRLLSAKKRDEAVELTFGGRLANGTFGREILPNVFGLEWLQTVRFLEGLPWLEIDLEIFWQAVDHRIRVAFPTRAITDRGLYHIPNGVLSRERYEMTENCLWSPSGDWPALHFAATEPDGSTPGLAVINTGTPAARIENGVLQYSVLRSPAFGHCLTRYAQEYTMPVTQMRDGGYHRFRFAVMPYTGQNLPDVLHAAAVYNEMPLTSRVSADTAEWRSGLDLEGSGAAIMAVKSSFAGAGLAVRVVEYLGQARTVSMTLPAGYRQAWSANLLEERENELPIQNGAVRLPLCAYGIHTLLLE